LSLRDKESFSYTSIIEKNIRERPQQLTPCRSEFNLQVVRKDKLKLEL